MYAQLDSVGSLMDFMDGMVYPMQTDGTPDLSCGTPASECCAEWWENLSPADAGIVASLGDGKAEID